MSFQDDRERIFVNGQIYSRPRFGGPVHGPDTRQFTPDPNPYGVEPETPRYGQGSVDVPDLRDLLFRPTDKFDIRKPVYRPGIDKFDIQPLTPPETGKREQSYQYLEQNNEVMGPKTQMFNRFANPADGTLTFGGPEAEGPGHVLRDGEPDPRMRGPLFPGDIENIDFEFQREMRKMLDEMYKNRRMNQAEPTGGQIARVDPTDKLLLKSLRKGEIGDPNSPRIRKAIIDLEKKIYNDGRASSMEGALMAADPSFKVEVSPQKVKEINRRLIPDYDLRREKLRRGFLSPLLRGA